jgi:Pentapeptide repeats (8 copies)
VAPEKTPRKLAEDLIKVLVPAPAWRPQLGPRQSLWVLRIAIIVGLVYVIGYAYGVTLWDWLELLIVPAVLAGGGLLFTQYQQKLQRLDDLMQQERGLEIEKQRAQDEALQAYLDQMGQLLLDKDRPLRQSKDDDVRTLARARTLTVLTTLDGERKRSVLRFLYESDVISRDTRVINLREADLREPKLDFAIWTYIDLSDADLRGADLSGATLDFANLKGTDLREAEGLTDEQIAAAYSLEGATMPNGQLYED